MTNWFLSILTVSLSVSLIAAILILGTSFLHKRYAAKWKYWIWIFLAVRLLLPFSGEEISAAIRTLLPKAQTASLATQSERTAMPKQGARVMVEIPAQMTTPIPVQPKESKTQITLLDLVAIIWLLGSLTFLAVHLVSYLQYKSHLKKYGTVIEDDQILHQLQELQQELAIKHSVCTMEYSKAASPMMIGFFHPVFVLPKEQKNCILLSSTNWFT